MVEKSVIPSIGLLMRIPFHVTWVCEGEMCIRDSISALASLKEVTGNIVIRNSYNGADLTGLDNIVSAGGLQVGSTDVASKATELHMISMKALETLSGDISVYNDQVTYVLFEKLATIEGSVMFNAPSLQRFGFPVLTPVGQDLNIQGN